MRAGSCTGILGNVADYLVVPPRTWKDLGQTFAMSSFRSTPDPRQSASFVPYNYRAMTNCPLVSDPPVDSTTEMNFYDL